VIRRGEIWWADLAEPRGSEPGFRRPVVVVQSDDLNASRLSTTVVAVLTSNLARAQAAGNVLCPARATGLAKDSVANVSQLVTIDKADLAERAGALPPRLLSALEAGLRLALDL
jgi:mRNA interferase MazF